MGFLKTLAKGVVLLAVVGAGGFWFLTRPEPQPAATWEDLGEPTLPMARRSSGPAAA